MNSLALLLIVALIVAAAEMAYSQYYAAPAYVGYGSYGYAAPVYGGYGYAPAAYAYYKK